jgi:sugar/nucleoside kinase (ribokinase family)
MNLPLGERTIFHLRGANAEFHPGLVDIDGLNCTMLHIGYIFLLDEFDSTDPEYGTVMARFLHDVQCCGIKTSIDVSSDIPADYPGKMIPALKYCNYVIIDEVECCGIWQLLPRHKDGKLNASIIREAMERTMSCGVKDKVIVHSREAMFCLDKTGKFTVMASLELQPEEIKGGVGVGDAFCAGALYGIYQKMSDADMLSFASAAAACNMRADNAVDGMMDKNVLYALMRNGKRKEINAY